jgi:predicted transposase YbfD/YdcC
MGGDAEGFAALSEAVVFMHHFKDLPDPRQPGKVIYPLDEVLLLCLLAVLAGAECFVDIARFGAKKIELLRRFRSFRDGTPSHDQLGDIFATLDARKFQQCFVAWVASLTGAAADVIAIDGKTMRRPYQKKAAKAPIHMVSAFAARQRLVLGQVKVAEKSNEIVAIPALLDMLVIEGAIISVDAMGCQRHIAEQIVEKKADYVLALKGNQGTCTRTSKFLPPNSRPMASRIATSVAIKPSMATTVASKPGPTRSSKVERETRFYLTSLAWLAHKIGPVVRSHWAIENSLYWVMDMIFRDDECRIRTDHAPANFTTIKHMALNLIRRAKGKDSFRLKRKIAAWDDDFLATLIAA